MAARSLSLLPFLLEATEPVVICCLTNRDTDFWLRLIQFLHWLFEYTQCCGRVTMRLHFPKVWYLPLNITENPTQPHNNKNWRHSVILLSWIKSYVTPQNIFFDCSDTSRHILNASGHQWNSSSWDFLNRTRMEMSVHCVTTGNVGTLCNDWKCRYIV